MSNGKAMMNLLTVGLMNKIWFYKIWVIFWNHVLIKAKKKLNKIYPIMKKNLTQKAQETLIYCNLLEKMT